MEIRGIGKGISVPKKSMSKITFENMLEESKKTIMSKSEIIMNLGSESLNNLSKLNCPELETDQLFAYLKAKALQFRSETQSKILKNNKGEMLFLLGLYDCLEKLLYDIILTKDKSIQKPYLIKVHSWFIKKMEMRQKAPKLAITKAQNQGQIQIIKIVKEPEDIYSLSTRQMYDEKLRTIYPEINSPKVRIEEYQHRILPSKIIDKNTNDNESENLSKSTTEYKLKSGSTFYGTSFYTSKGTARYTLSNDISGKSNYLEYFPTLDAREQKLEKFWLINRNMEIKNKRAKEEIRDVKEQYGDIKSSYNGNINRKLENLNFGSKFSDRGYRKAKKGNPFNKKFDKKYYEIKFNEKSFEEEKFLLNEEYEIPRNKFELEKLEKKENIKKLETIESKVVVEGEGKGKGKANGEAKEENNNNQTDKNDQSPNNCNMPEMNNIKAIKDKVQKNKKINPLTPKSIINMFSEHGENDKMKENLKYLYSDSDKKRIERIRRMHGKIIDGENNKMEADNPFLNEAACKAAISISVYNKLKYQKRPFSVLKNNQYESFRIAPITARISIDKIRTTENNEINNISNSLNQKQIPYNAHVLRRAILTPKGFSRDKMIFENLPSPGSRLIQNPFVSKTKINRKKGKKGKKKTKAK